MTFDLNAVSPRLVEVWERTRLLRPEYVRINAKPLEDIEKDCGRKFPEDYWNFMNQYGSISLDLGDINTSIVQYSIGSAIKKDWQWIGGIADSDFVLEYYMKLSRPHIHFADLGPMIPPKTVPIGYTADRDEFYLMDLSEEKYGRIWHKGEGTRATWGTEGNMILGFVAPSFTTFLAGLMTQDEAERKLAEEGR